MPRLRGRIDTDGAILNVRVSIEATEAISLAMTGKTEPKPFSTTALIDTGASHTAVAPMVLNHLGAMPRGFTRVGVPGLHDSIIRLYDARIALGPEDVPLFEVQVVALPPATPSVLVLLGRDILDRTTLLFDGRDKEFTIWF
jgi:predicted aspartyl protease